MKRAHAVVLALICLLGACTKPNGPGSGAGDQKGPADASLPQDKSAASGTIELLFYDERVPTNIPAQPTLRLKTRVKVVEGGIMSFESAEAVFTSPDGTESYLRAGAGEYDQSAKRIALTGGITLDSGGLHIELADILWTNETQSAHSEKPAIIRNNATVLTAATFVFYPRGDETDRDQEVLVLSEATGDIDLASGQGAETVQKAAEPVAESGDAPVRMDFDRMVLDKAPTVRMVARRLRSITGGVNVELISSKSEQDAIRLSSDVVSFEYSEAVQTLPTTIKLEGNVQLGGPLGQIASKTAVFDLAQKQILFVGAVRGASPEVQEFQADRLAYAAGRLELEGRVHVATADGKVDAGRAVRDDKKHLMTFSEGVVMSGAEGTIRSSTAELDEASRRMVFSGGVQGDLGDIRGFSASRIVYDLEKGDADLTDLKVRRIEMKKTEEKSDGSGLDFSEMSIEKAPQVRVKEKRVEAISGGMEFLLRSAAREDEGMRVRAAAAEFVYGAEGGTLPSVVRLKGGVHVTGAQGEIRSQRAEMSPQAKRFVFSGEVAGRTPDIPQFRAGELMYDPQKVVLQGAVEILHQDGTIRAERAELNPATKELHFTGNVHGDAPPVRGLAAEELYFNPATNEVRIAKANIAELNPRGEKPEGAFLLKESDIRDWPRFLQLLRSAERASDLSAARRVVSLLTPEFRSALYRLAPDRTPNATVQEEILRQLNPLLTRNDLYDADAWRSIRLDKETNALVTRNVADLSKAERVRMNRGLFESAFPECIAPVTSEGAQP